MAFNQQYMDLQKEQLNIVEAAINCRDECDDSVIVIWNEVKTLQLLSKVCNRSVVFTHHDKNECGGFNDTRKISHDWLCQQCWIFYIATNGLQELAPKAPSITRWSHVNVTFIRHPTVSSPLTTTGSVEPTANMAAFGGLIIAVKCSICIIPRLEIVNVESLYSSALNFLSFVFVQEL